MRKNHIREIMIKGVRVTDPKVVKDRIRDFFENHYKIVHWQQLKITGLGSKSLTDYEKCYLERPFREEKAMIKDDFMRFIHGFHEAGSIVKDLNKTFIALIPKYGKPESLKDFRPISLGGSMYKVLAKVLANRFKEVMDTVIGDTQMAFVRNRQILDSFVIVEDIIHSWRKDSERALLAKLDFSL
ncbi:hypothetical protein Ddye_001998 [Dipteronia dyeriana]|uniref:Reverse transcriptase domain-containing protein n=1 Tax=Dipteronia dyeriana TaxID=168575 RepID=A0AAD9XPQ0_9ROSI|nr:hypothetical protein Ddye_001998 [Dipteronia dyeriana]